MSSSNNTSSSKRSRDNISYFERNLFSKALSEANVPYDWIKNAQQLEIIKNYKRNKFQHDNSNIISDSIDDWVMEVNDDIADFQRQQQQQRTAAEQSKEVRNKPITWLSSKSATS